MQTTKKSANEVTSRRSSTRISIAFFDSAARTAVNQGRGFKRGSGGINCGIQLLSNSKVTLLPVWYTEISNATIAFVLLCFASVSVFARRRPDDPGQRRSKTLQTNALSWREELTDQGPGGDGRAAAIRLVEAEQNLADAQDDAVLGATLYSDLDVKNLSDQTAEERWRPRSAAFNASRSGSTGAKLVDSGIHRAPAIDPLQRS